ncbi:hypothetical protein [Streptomyces mirabilis]|uniref:hypothetical protein n=1 Tax=Streptomyces mirabilis TaxID=68239 RepID=UPI0036A697B1
MLTRGDIARRSVGKRVLSYAFRTLIAVIGAAIVVGAIVSRLTGYPDSPAHPKVTPSAKPVPFVIDNPSLPDDEIEGYWYCWNSGGPAPHHLDHWVPNDHLCTWGELRSAGATQ